MAENVLDWVPPLLGGVGRWKHFYSDTLDSQLLLECVLRSLAPLFWVQNKCTHTKTKVYAVGREEEKKRPIKYFAPD